MPSSDPQSNAPSKHRACDECRSRKLACSKEPDGCSRCVREGIKCHYSQQKPMGRPRKRHFTGETKDSASEIHSVIPEIDPLPYFDESFPTDPYIDSTSIPFLSQTCPQSTITPEGQAAGLYTIGADGRIIVHFGADEFNTPIDFSVDYTNSEEPIVPTAPEAPIERCGFPEGHQLDLNAAGPPCSCLATMYLAMSSLQEFPMDIETALGTVRAAANTAQASIRCDKCGTCESTNPRPPIESFQNTMLLGTILPIIVNGYKRLLNMVDNETNMAKAAGIKKIFRVGAYGGLCGPRELCGEAKHLEHAVMEPTEWRNAVRGLLRADVYGFDGVTPGLKGIIAEMEHRQRSRHKLLDQLRDTASLQEVTQRKCLGENDVLCLRIIDTAKVALNSLVIA